MKRTIWSNEAVEDDCKNNDLYLDDERANLDITLDNKILCIASMGLWNGRKQGYKILTNNIKDILYSDCDYCSWYSDGYNIKAKLVHHDGTNYIEYREIKNNDNIDNLLNDIYNGKTISRARLNYYTKSILPKVSKVYGW